MAAVVVRRLAPDDLSALLRLYAQLHPDDPQVAPVVLERTWARITNDPGLVYVGVFIGPALVATCHAALIPNLTRGARQYAVIENVVTDRAHQRRGFGALAMRSLIALCWEADCYKIMLMSGTRRAEIHPFYETLGFDRKAKQAFVLERPSSAPRPRRG
jgi:GNAT superfamily N-acetyltransferase